MNGHGSQTNFQNLRDKKVFETLNSGSLTTIQALEAFDSLEPVDVDFMLGRWAGDGFHTGHPLDGILEAYHWYGKRFESVEEVHPLVFSTLSGGKVYVNPIFMGPLLTLAGRLPLPRSPIVGRIVQVLLPLFTTSRSKARLRMTTYRAQTSATMIYDQLPANDIFRKVDEETVVGVTDLKGMAKPLFFILYRERV